MRHVPALLILLPVLFSAQAAYGHGMHVLCHVAPPDRVVVNASWGEDEPVAQGAVTVFDANGDALARGTTDAAGRFECTIAKPQGLIVEVVFAGHRGECEIDAAAFEGAAAESVDEDELPLESAVSEDGGHHGHSHDAHEHSHDESLAHEHAAVADEHEHADNQTAERAAVDATAHTHGDDHEHAAGDDHRAELLSGIALILSAASFLMVVSLRREVSRLVEKTGGKRS